MDWRVPNGMATVLAAADGTASLYLSSGGGYLGGGQKYPEIRAAVLRAVDVTTRLLPLFAATESSEFPEEGEVFFYVMTGTGVRRARAAETSLRTGTDPLEALGGAMQAIITEYRVRT